MSQIIQRRINYLFPVMPNRRNHYLRFGWIGIKKTVPVQMLPSLFILITAMRKAMPDTLKHLLDTSIFSKLNSKICNPKVSLDYVRLWRFTQYRTDAWQLLNSGMNVMFRFAYPVPRGATPWYREVCVACGLHMPVNTIYNQIMKRK